MTEAQSKDILPRKNVSTSVSYPKGPSSVQYEWLLETVREQIDNTLEKWAKGHTSSS